MPLDPISKRAGGLCFAKGTHLWDRYFQEEGHPLVEREDRRFGENNKYQAEDIPEFDDDSDVIYFDYEPSDVAVFGMKRIHKASGDETTTVTRRALTTRWWGDDLVFDFRPRQLGPLANVDLNTGDSLDGCPRFPTVWRRSNEVWQRSDGSEYDPSDLLRGPIDPREQR